MRADLGEVCYHKLDCAALSAIIKWRVPKMLRSVRFELKQALKHAPDISAFPCVVWDMRKLE